MALESLKVILENVTLSFKCISHRLSHMNDLLYICSCHEFQSAEVCSSQWKVFPKCKSNLEFCNMIPPPNWHFQMFWAYNFPNSYLVGHVGNYLNKQEGGEIKRVLLSSLV